MSIRDRLQSSAGSETPPRAPGDASASAPEAARALSQDTIVSLWALAAWAVGVALAFQWIPFARYGWAFNLWQYLPAVCAPFLAGVSLLLCSASLRRALLARFETRGRGSASDTAPAWPTSLALFAAGSALFWLLREREDFGDSVILLWSVAQGRLFHFPDVGSTFLFGVLLRSGVWLLGDLDSAVAFLRFAVCLCGGVFVVLMAHAGRRLSPGRPAAAAGLVAAGGLVRIFAGHAEVYAFLFVALAAFLWRALAWLAGEGRLSTVALLLGVALWLHASSAFLVPGLLVLWRWGRPGDGRPALREGLRCAAWLALPYASFLLAAVALGAAPTIVASFTALLESLQQGSADQPLHRLIRLPGGPPSTGTDYVLLSAGHLKYLLNAAHVLTPGALPVLIGFALLRPRGLAATAAGSRGRFLIACVLPLVLYSLVLRPLWGPYDWDLFAITAFFTMGFVVVLLDERLDRDTFAHASFCIVGLSVLFVTLPFLATAVATPRAAGPFTHGHSEWQAETARGRPHPALAPWL